MEAPDESHARLLDGVLADGTCVSAWLGYGEVLFLGFGDEVLPEQAPDGSRPWPLAELETNYADWCIQGLDPTFDGEQDRAAAERAARDLIGRRVMSWKLLAPSNGLAIQFAGDKTLVVEPWVDEDVRHSDAWSLTLPDRRVLAVSGEGRMILADEDTPVAHWFGKGRSWRPNRRVRRTRPAG